MRAHSNALAPDFVSSSVNHLPSQRDFIVDLLALAVIGCVYYSLYYDYYFNWADEGSVALIAEKLANGETPYVDVEPGYGILWFYPISILFKLFGVSFLVVRVWFIVLGFTAALLSYALLWRLTRHRVITFLTALLVLLLPGSGYKTYIPLLVIAGAYVLFLYDAKTLKSTIAPWLALTAAGAYFAIAFLIRGDIATAYVALFLLYHGLITLQASIRERDPKRFLLFPARFAGVLLIAAIVTTPLAIHAREHGYVDGFLGQYTQFAKELISKLHARYVLPSTAVAMPSDEVAGTLLPRPNLRSLFWPGHTQWVFLTYAPLLVPLVVCFYLCLNFLKRRSSAVDFSEFLSESTYVIVLSIGAFAAFPQFFVFRPDIFHLSEFIPGFIVLCGYVFFLMRTQVGATMTLSLDWRKGYYQLVLMRAQVNAKSTSAVILRGGYCIFVMLCLVYLVAYVRVYPEGVERREGRTNRLQISDRLDIHLNRIEHKILSGLSTIILQESGPDDYLLCFPYCPGINFITGRPTFQRHLYVDDSVLVSRPGWLSEMREEIVTKRPKIIVIWNWDINRTNISRFSVWAAPLYNFIGDRYELRAKLAGNEKDQSWFEVYVLK